MNKPLRIGMVAGEPSGDVLAAGMVAELKRLYPDAIIEGIGGQHMQAEGFTSLFDMETLSVMGLVEVLSHLPAILKVKKALLAHFDNNPPDIFVGIDAPDFNLRVEKALKQKGIKTIHYVSPTIWAWREKRVHNIAKAAGRVLGIFPFEQQVYDKYDVPYTFVGHTMADSIALVPNQAEARSALHLAKEKSILAVLPGSRRGEVDTLLPIFIKTMEKVAAQRNDIQFVIPAANHHRLAQINAILMQADNAAQRLPIHVTEGTARDAMIASDVVMLASGTATLEAMLCKRPMVVAYKLSPLTHKIMQRLYKAPYFALPNLLANEGIVPELLQDEVNPTTLSEHVMAYFKSDNTALISRFTQLHHTLKCNADKTAAKALVEELFA